MSEEFKPKSWAAPVSELVKEYNEFDAVDAKQEVLTEPEEFSKAMVRKGLLDPNTGEYGKNSKAAKCASFVPSAQYMNNHERIFGH